MLYGWKDSFYVVLLRVLIGSLLGGTFLGITFFMSLSGGITSAAVMKLVYKRYCCAVSLVGISIVGSVVHVIAQIIAAGIITSKLT